MYPVDIQSCSLFKIIHQLRHIFGFYQVNFFISYSFPGFFTASENSFNDVSKGNDEDVCRKKFDITYSPAEHGIDHPQTYYNKKVCHIFYRHGFGAITQQPEKGKQAKSKSHADIKITHQSAYEEDNEVEKEKSK